MTVFDYAPAIAAVIVAAGGWVFLKLLHARAMRQIEQRKEHWHAAE
jgi:hypothetical protein